MGAELAGHTWTHLDTASREECAKAARYVTGMVAKDRADAAQLLAILGLLPATHPAVMRPEDHGIRGYRLGCRCKRCRKSNSMRLSRQRAAKKGATA